MRPRVGYINFLNCFPLYYRLNENIADYDMELVPGTPVELNNLMLNEKLDISPISSIEYFRHSDKYLLFPDLTVSSSGHVRSVILFSKVPISELDGEKIALANTSSTSHVLLQIILKYRYGIKSEFFSCKPNLKLMLERAKAALIIGDKAIEESITKNGLYYYDLGEEWQKFSGKKMVYALWCVRKSFAMENPDIAKSVLKALIESSCYCRNNLQKIAMQASYWKKFGDEFIKEYLTDLDFYFDKEAKDGLMMFSKLAKESGCIKKNGRLKFFDDGNVYGPK